MSLARELKAFDKSCAHLHERIDIVSSARETSPDDEFVAEAVAFRLFRIQERLIRSFFLESCTKTRSPAKKKIVSKLRCRDWETAEEILKANNKYLDWGNPNTVRNLANLVFENGYPVNDLIQMMQSTMVDLQRIRNFIAHDSREAQASFSKTTRNYVKAGDPEPRSAGELLLYRKRVSAQTTLRIVFNQVRQFTQIVRTV